MLVQFIQTFSLLSIATVPLFFHSGIVSASNTTQHHQALQKRIPYPDSFYTFVDSMEELRENVCAGCIYAAVNLDGERSDQWEENLEPKQLRAMRMIRSSVEEIIRDHGGGSVPRRKARFECSKVLRKYIADIIETELNVNDPELEGSIFDFITTPNSLDQEGQRAVLEEFRKYFESEQGENVFNCVEALEWWVWDETW